MTYFDYNSTYPSSSKHFKQCLELLKSCDGNPSSTHSVGRKAKLILEEAREHVARLLGVSSQLIFFNSGATEANNSALSMVLNRNSREIIAMTDAEHPSLIATARHLEKNNFCKLGLLHLGTSTSLSIGWIWSSLR